MQPYWIKRLLLKITSVRSEPNIRGRIPDTGYAYVSVQLAYPASIGTSLLLNLLHELSKIDKKKILDDLNIFSNYWAWIKDYIYNNLILQILL